MGTIVREFCDQCGREIKARPFGPLEVSITAPRLTLSTVSGMFCSADCLIKWVNTTALRQLSE